MVVEEGELRSVFQKQHLHRWEELFLVEGVEQVPWIVNYYCQEEGVLVVAGIILTLIAQKSSSLHDFLYLPSSAAYFWLFPNKV